MMAKRVAQEPTLQASLDLQATITDVTSRNRHVSAIALLQGEGSDDTTVGTSTNCSAVCGSLRTLREQRDDEIFGTAITCSGIGVSRCKSEATSCPICARECPESEPWARRRRAAPRCAAGPAPVAPRGLLRQGGWRPLGSSSNNWKSSGWEVGSRGSWPYSTSRTSPHLALSFHRPLELWCFFSDRAIATLRRPCRKNCLSRHSRRLRAALTLSTSIMTSTAEAIFVQATQQTSGHSCGKIACCCCF